MDIKLLAFIIILTSLGSAIWNTFVKHSENGLLFVTLMTFPQFVVAGIILFFVSVPQASSFYYIVTSALVQTGYIIFLSSSYNYGMLSRVYPFATGMASLLSLLFWYFYLHKHLSFYGDIGVIILSLSVISITFVKDRAGGRVNFKAMIYAIITSLFIVCYSLIDTFGVRTTDRALSYIAYLFVIKAVMLVIPMLLMRKIKMRAIKMNWTKYTTAGLLAFIGYGVVIWAFLYSATPVVLAFRSSAIVFVLLISYFYLKEKISLKILLLGLTTAMGVYLIIHG